MYIYRSRHKDRDRHTYRQTDNDRDRNRDSNRQIDTGKTTDSQTEGSERMEVQGVML